MMHLISGCIDFHRYNTGRQSYSVALGNSTSGRPFKLMRQLIIAYFQSTKLWMGPYVSCQETGGARGLGYIPSQGDLLVGFNGMIL